MADLSDVIPGRVEDANPESRDSPMCYCTSEVWSFGPSRNDKPSPRKLHEMTYTPAPRDPKQTPVRINLLSDTQTRPTPAMREAIARAEVGDEQLGDDPTVNMLCERVADLLGKEAAVFMPSGTMCNVAATLTHCRPGDEILAHETAHIIAREGGAHAALGGFQIAPLSGADGKFSPDTFRKALLPAPDLVDEISAAGDGGADRGAQAFGEIEPGGIPPHRHVAGADA